MLIVDYVFAIPRSGHCVATCPAPSLSLAKTGDLIIHERLLK
jgi:hypothetical protein